MKVRVVVRFVDRGVIVRHPGEILDVSEEAGKQFIKAGVAKAVKRKEPSEDKALRPSENKGAANEGESA